MFHIRPAKCTSPVRRFFAGATLLLLLASLALPQAAGAAREGGGRPNIIFILTDDQGWGDAHFAGHPQVRTPNLDRLAAGGTWFRQFYVAATVCSPSRAAFMTSHCPARHQVHGHFADSKSNAARSMPDWLDPDVTTLPDLLKKAGYATAHFGKWHLGAGEGAPPPEAYGIDVSKTVNSSGPSLGNEGAEPYFRAKSTRLIVDETIEFIRRNQGSPFYVNLWTLLPHAALKPTPEQLAEYAALQPSADDPAYGAWMQKYLAGAKDLRSQMQVFLASLTDLDTQVGRLLDALDEMKISENTLIVYSSDNGPEDYRIGNAANAGVGSTGVLRGRKRSMYEGGIRTFGLVRWPGHVPAGRVDETSVVGAVDLLPTVASLAGVSLPEGLAPDGEDLSQLWLGGAFVPRRRPLHWEWLFNVQGAQDGYMPPMLAVRDGGWKLLVNHDGGKAELYDLTRDPAEEHDLAKAEPERVKSLTEKAMAWVRTLPPSPARDLAARTGRPVDARPPVQAKQAPAAAGQPLAERARVFGVWDTDRDGFISFKDFQAGLNQHPEAADRFRRRDKDGDGKLSRDEFVNPIGK